MLFVTLSLQIPSTIIRSISTNEYSLQNLNCFCFKYFLLTLNSVVSVFHMACQTLQNSISNIYVLYAIFILYNSIFMFYMQYLYCIIIFLYSIMQYLYCIIQFLYSIMHYLFSSCKIFIAIFLKYIFIYFLFMLYNSIYMWYA